MHTCRLVLIPYLNLKRKFDSLLGHENAAGKPLFLAKARVQLMDVYKFRKGSFSEIGSDFWLEISCSVFGSKAELAYKFTCRFFTDRARPTGENILRRCPLAPALAGDTPAGVITSA